MNCFVNAYTPVKL